MFKSILNPTKSELQQEKQKDYRNIVILQIIIVVFGLTLTEFVIDGKSQTAAGKFVTSIFLMFGTVYNFLLWDLTRNFTRNRILTNTIFISLVAIVIIGTLGEFPYYKIIHITNRQLYLLFLHSFLFPIEVTVISFAMRDIFSGEFLTPDKLWGSACVFLMIGISFGSLYDLICIISPGSLGEDIEMGLPNYSECIHYSMSILGGMDPGHPNASRLIRNIGVFEAVWGNLFVVLVIGKLMGLPRPPKTEPKEVS